MTAAAPRHFVVDGSNIATEGRSAPSLRQLNEAVLAFMEDHPGAVVTVVVCLVTAPQVQWGVVAGVVLALALHLWRELRLELDLWVENDLLHVRPQGVLYFGSAPALETRILTELAEHPRLSRVEIHLQRLGRVDLTGALVLRAICRDLARADVRVVLSGAQPQYRGLLERVLAGEGIDYTHGPRNTISPAEPRLRERRTD